MDFKLTAGSVAKLMAGEDIEKEHVFQILGTKKIAGQGGTDRYRLNISDGLHSHTFAMLATQLNPMILNGELNNFTVIKVAKIVANNVSANKKVFIIIELEILGRGEEVGRKIGNPVQYTEGSAVSNGTTNGGSRLNGSGAAPPPVKQEFPTKSASSFYSGGAGQGASARAGDKRVSTAAFGAAAAIDGTCIPIRDITPYNSKCSIKARITSKSPVRTWSNSRGDGKLFSIDLLDESGEIRMTGFNNAVDQFYENLKVNDVYIFSKFTAKAANKQFTNLNHEYEISFGNDSQVVPCLDADAGEIPTLSFSFVEISSIENLETNSTIDVLGVCKSKGDLVHITSKAGKELTKREIVLVDKTNTEVVMTLWGKQAEDFNDDTNPIVAVKGAKVGDFQGKNLSLLNSSTMMINPDMPESHELRGWYDNEGVNAQAKSLVVRGGGGGASANAPWKMMREVQTIEPSSAEAGYYFKSKVFVLAIRRSDNTLYRACPEDRCNKKLSDVSEGIWRCEKCMKETPDFKWRLMLQASFGDGSDAIWATCFQDQGELIIGEKTETLGAVWSGNEDGKSGQDMLDGYVKQASFKQYIVKFRAKLETFNNENRIKYSVMDVQPLNFQEYAQATIAEIKELAGCA